MFLSEKSGEKISELLEWTPNEIRYWYVEAVKLHNKMNKVESNDG